MKHYLSNLKRKHFAAIIAVLLIAVIGIGGYTSISKNSKYNAIIEDICGNEFESAQILSEDLPAEYREIEEIKSYITIIQSIDDISRKEYSAALDELNDIDFSDERLKEHYDDFKAELTQLKNTYETDLKAAQVIDAEIAEIGNGTITKIQLSEKEKIHTARENYDKCRDGVKELVENAGYLSAAEMRITLLESAQPVIDQINAIGAVTLESKTAIESAQTAYDALSYDAQACVTNSDTLKQAQQEMQILLEAQEVINQIDGIGKVTLNSEETIQAAELAYNNLSDDAKGHVTNLDKLKTARTSFDSLKNSSKNTESNTSTSNYGTVYWVASGEVYHVTKNCPTLRRSKNIYSGSTPPSGRRACKVCS